MATVHVAIGFSAGSGANGVPLPVRRSAVSRSVVLTSTSTSAQASPTTTAAEFAAGAVWFITVTGNAVDVTAGADPTAVSTNSHRVLDGQSLELVVGAAGEKLAIKDV